MKELPPETWLPEQIVRYEAELEIFEEFAGILKTILSFAAKRYAPNSFVQARAKDTASFADKALRKWIQYKGGKYQDPLVAMTDLAGARVVTQSVEEVDRIGQFVRAVFVIDEANSEDTGKRLQDDQFGYRSVHFVISLPGRVTEALNTVGITQEQLDKVGPDRKAELQIRTLSQHIWADVGHDRIYKNIYDSPAEWRRQLAGIGAALEQVDQGLTSLIAKTDAHKRHHAKFRTSGELARQLATLGALLSAVSDEDKKALIALQMAWLYSGIGDNNGVIDVLKPYLGRPDATGWEIALEYGCALCRQYQDTPKVEVYVDGLACLKGVADNTDETDGPGMPVDPAKHRTRTHAYYILGQQYLAMADTKVDALDNLREAYYRNAADPYYLAAYIESQVYATSSRDFIGLLVPQIQAAMAVCRQHVQLGIDLPYAYFALARLSMFLQNSEKALDAYLKAIQISLKADSRLPDDIFERELRFLTHLRLQGVQDRCQAWAKRILEMAQTIRKGGTGNPHHPNPWKQPVLIVAGTGAEPIPQQEPPLAYLFGRFSGTVISGGTTAGVSGLVGAAAAEVSKKNFTLLGYMPSKATIGTQPHFAYDRIIHTSGADFGYDEPLQYWEDLLKAGIIPRNVRVLGFGGGSIALFEYKLALTFGACLGLAKAEGNAGKLLVDDAEWDHTNVNELPCDPSDVVDRMILYAFVMDASDPMGRATHAALSLAATGEALDRAAQVVHDAYRTEALPKANEESIRPWDKLSEHLKEANRGQVRSAEWLLRVVGLGLRPVDPQQPDPEALILLHQSNELLAEMEHGRWTVERFRQGFRYGAVKDQEKRRHPSLIAWNDPRLDDDTKNYDRSTIRSWPKVFEAIGWEIYRLSPDEDSNR